MCSADTKGRAVVILMAVYNGERWVQKQIESIQKQSISNWKLVISDDCSTDSTRQIVENQARCDSRIVVLPPSRSRIGYVLNFQKLLLVAEQDKPCIIFLSDQDDLWNENKILRIVRKMDNYTPRPTVVFSDMEIIDINCKELGSFVRKIGLAAKHEVHDLICSNTVPGCSMALNSELLDIAMPFPKQTKNHDWWLALCAATSGQLVFIDERLTLYRQHETNEITTNISLQKLLGIPRILRRQKKVFNSKLEAVAELSRRLENRSLEIPESIKKFESLFQGKNGWKRFWAYIGSEFIPNSKKLAIVQAISLTPFVGRNL